jgi:alpha-L-rhamnosidase
MQQILGVRPTQPGFARVQIRPFTAQLDWAKGTVPTPKGDIEVSWKRQPEFELQLTLPPGVEADIILPNEKTFQRGAGSYTIK